VGFKKIGTIVINECFNKMFGTNVKLAACFVIRKI